MPSLRGAFLALSLVASSYGQTLKPTPTLADPTEVSPSATGQPCGAISSAIQSSLSDTVAVPAELAFQCLRSVPIDLAVANATMDAVIRMVRFQSTLAYLKNPPSGYANPPVDLLGGLDDIASKVAAGEYQREYDWEGDVSNLLDKAFDGHLAFEGFAWSGAFTWRRSRAITLAIASVNGAQPQVWCIRDFNTTATFTPSPVSQINGQDVNTFLQDLSLKRLYHDPDARWNTLSLMQAAESNGGFVTPPDYPGPTTNITFANGTTNTYRNSAIVNDPTSWNTIRDGQTFYNRLIALNNGNQKRQAAPPTETKGIPKRLRFKKTVNNAANGSVPASYPEPFFQHSNADVGMGGFFIDDPAFPNLGVLMLQTFSTSDAVDTQEWQQKLQDFLAEAKSRGTQKLIVDVRENGGGKIFLGYDTFRQLFPNVEGFGGNRYRAHDASNILGTQISTLKLSSSTANAVTSPFNFASYLDEDLKAFSNWQGMFGPKSFNNDNFTNIIRYNLSSPIFTSDPNFGIGITITGYGDRSNFTQPPFSKDDIVILSDGVCASTCALFVEMMVHQAGVRTMAIGGRPQSGPMQAVGGTKGSQVLTSDYLVYLSNFVFNSFRKTEAVTAFWDNTLPFDFSMKVDYASINFQDNIRQGQTAQGIPTQFVNDTANCRLWYTPSMYLNVTEVWSTVAAVAWSNGNTMNQDQCVSGSFTARASVGETSTTTTTSTTAEGSTSAKAKSAAPGRLMPPISVPILAACLSLLIAIIR